MPPAFDSTKQAASFALLLLFLLAAPWLGGKTLLPPREQAYAAGGWAWGPYPWIQKQIFEETNDIDIAFLGSSRIDWAIDTPYVQEKLDEQLGRKTVVRSICWAGAGFDSLYITAKDLLEHRHVKTLVFCDESPLTEHALSADSWFRFSEDASLLSGLPPGDKAYYYFAAMVGMPRNMLEVVTPNLPEVTNSSVLNYYEVNFHAPNPETRLGAVISQFGFNDYGKLEPFVPYLPKTGVTPADVSIYTPATASNFKFSNRRLPAWQIHFARLLALTVKNHGCKLVLLHLPIMDERDSSVITEPVFWPDLLQTDVAMLGIPTGRLFAGLPEQDIKRLFRNHLHLNQNGAEYFTPLIVPALVQLYEDQSDH